MNLSKEKKNIVERIYVIPLKKVFGTPKNRRAKKAIKTIREFTARHMKTSEIVISEELNEKIWSKGIQSPPRRITVKMIKDEDGIVKVSLPIKEISSKEPEVESQT